MARGPNRRPWRIVEVGIVAGVFLLGVSVIGCKFYLDGLHNGIRVKRLAADLNARLPNGSTWEQAEAWFASHGFRTNLMTDDGDRVLGL